MSAKFFKAIQTGDMEKVELLLHKDPNLLLAKDKKNMSALMVAMHHHQAEIADFMVERIVVLSIHEAAATGKMNQIISILARKPELVNSYSEDGFQPLGLAAYFGQMEALEYLIKAGAELNSTTRNKTARTPLQLAIEGAHVEISRILLENGASPNVRDESGDTPLHTAARRGDVELVRNLLFGGADLEAFNKENETPLSLATQAGYIEVTTLLNAGITRRFRGNRLKR